MPTEPIRPLSPGPERPLVGAHLAADIRSRGSAHVYTGFVASLDGRVALGDAWGPPDGVRNDRDWRMLLELAMQADAVLLSGTSVARLANGFFGDPDERGFADLVAWRRDRGLTDKPAAVVMSRRGRFEPDALAAVGDRVLLAVGEPLPDDVAAAYADVGVEVVTAGDDGLVDPERMVAGLAGRGIRYMCSVAGPRVLHDLVPVLDTVFLTIVARFVAGEDFASLVEGPVLDPAPGFRFRSAWVDEHGPDGADQLFVELARG